MKRHLISFLLLLISNFSFSQNGGQFNENNVAVIRLIAYSDGNYIFTVKNKQNCVTTIRTRTDTDPAVDYTVNPNDSVWVYIPRPPLTQIKFRAKAETSCPNFTNPDMGFLEIITILGTLSLNENPYINIPRNKTDLNVSMNGTKLKTITGNVNYIQDIIIYDDLGRIIYKIKRNIKGYSEYDLHNFMKNGFNIIKVFVDDKKYSNFTFKLIKN